VPMGAGATAFVASTSGILQQRTPPAMRGRVLALQSTAFLGSTFIGAPLTGWIADRAGAGWAVSYGGIITLATLAGYSWVVRNRQDDTERPNPSSEPAGALA
jgi:MFS family permease